MIKVKIIFFLMISMLAHGQKQKTSEPILEKQSLMLFTEGAKKDIFINGKTLASLKSLELSEGSYFIESNGSELRMKWGKQLKLKLFEKAKVQLEIKKNLPPVLIHKVGKIQMVLQDLTLNYQVEKLFQFNIQSGELVVDIKDPIRSVKFSSLQGDQKVQIIEDDRVQLVKEGQSLELTPEWSEGEMIYDFLLNNKKIPRMHAVQGSVMEETRVSESQWKFVVEKKSVKKPLKKEDLTQEQLEQKIKQVKFSKTICRHPNGIYGECLWEKELNKCVRYSCNLNGEWAQKTEFNLNSECPRKKQIKSCEWLR